LSSGAARRRFGARAGVNARHAFTPTARRGYKNLFPTPLLFILAAAQSFPLRHTRLLFPRPEVQPVGHEANGFGRRYLHEWEVRALYEARTWRRRTSGAPALGG
jgi:hypothetical protein